MVNAVPGRAVADKADVLEDAGRVVGELDEVLGLWREGVGSLPDVLSLKFTTPTIGPGGLPPDFELFGVMDEDRGEMMVEAIDTVTFTDPITIAGGTINDAVGTDIASGTNSVTLAGNVSPGQSPGILIVTGNFAFGTGATFEAEIMGATPGTQHDQIDVTGTVNINNATLNVDDASFTAVGNEVFVLINNDGAEKIGYTAPSVQGQAEVVALVKGADVYSRLKFESGVHRVQRVPATEAHHPHRGDGPIQAGVPTRPGGPDGRRPGVREPEFPRRPVRGGPARRVAQRSGRHGGGRR